MIPGVTGWVVTIALAIQPVFLLYFLLYSSYTLWLIGLSAVEVRRRVAAHSIEDLDLIDEGDLTKPLTMIVPAFNEEVTIVDSVTRLIQGDYPRFEVVVINDGSSDGTLERLRRAFRLRQTDVPYRPAITTARIRAIYEAAVPLPREVQRLIVIDKENGGKADALNAGINASLCPYFVSLDAGSILAERALKEMMRVILGSPGIMAVGGQLAVANGCTVRNGRVVSAGLPARALPRFQIVEYLRSVTSTQTGLGQLDSILILRGACALFEKETVIRAGGYLTPLLDHRVSREYVGHRVGAACEDVEIVVRLHCFVLDKLQNRRIAFLPHPVAWTEVPETFESLREQRSRWYRGLREALRYHRAMLWHSRYGRIGFFVLPAFWLFEYYGPLIELSAYLSMLFLLVTELLLGYRVMDYFYLWAFLLASMGSGILLNILAVVLGAWRFRYGLADRVQRQLLPFGRRREVAILLGYAVLESFGYRQLTLYWRLRGLWDAWRGKSGRERFARSGFHPATAAVDG
ncbi:MAG TPA: glycosyltransferase [Gemmatimonadales bacterium]|nr:glycosyltransferase [Gemmatimonadales bacterium]